MRELAIKRRWGWQSSCTASNLAVQVSAARETETEREPQEEDDDARV